MTQRREDPVAVAAEHAPTAQCVLRAGAVVYANRALGELLDRDPTDIEGETFATFVSDEDRDRVLDELSSLEGSRTLRFKVNDDARRARTIESQWRVVEIDHGGPPGERTPTLVGTLEDATERLELERESEMLESALENLPMSIYFKDRQSRHERVSEHMLCQDEDSVITNTEGKRHPHREDLIGKTDFDIYSGEWVADAVAEDDEVMESGEPIVNEVTESTTNLGETFFSSTTKAPRYDEDGNVVGIVGVTMDVTDRMTYERELERQNERMEEFTEVLTHDLRNPLTVASSYAGMLDEKYDDDEAIEKLRDSLRRMASLITEIRSFVLEGRTVESTEPESLAPLAREAWDCVKTDAATLEVTATHTIRADDCRLQQLLENLYSNALDHGGDDVTITIGDLEDGFYVADDGPGVPDEDKAHVFERGFSTDDASTGFGLAIVKNIAEAHDWTVSITDSADGGARFEFREVVRVDDSADADEGDQAGENHDARAADARGGPSDGGDATDGSDASNSGDGAEGSEESNSGDVTDVGDSDQR